VEEIQGRYESSRKIRLKHSAGRGYYLTMPFVATAEQLAAEFIQVSKQGKCLHFGTAALSSLNTRIRQSLVEVLLMTDRVIGDVVQTVRENASILHQVSEALSLLDFVVALATFTSSSSDKAAYCRPEIIADSPMSIKQGRHPLAERLQKAITIVRPL
jgi:DNA mismatch repair protein MSH4